MTKITENLDFCVFNVFHRISGRNLIYPYHFCCEQSQSTIFQRPTNSCRFMLICFKKLMAILGLGDWMKYLVAESFPRQLIITGWIVWGWFLKMFIILSGLGTSLGGVGWFWNAYGRLWVSILHNGVHVRWTSSWLWKSFLMLQLDNVHNDKDFEQTYIKFL